MARNTKTEADPILTEATTVTIAGVTYTLRRLGLQDVFKVARILGNGIAVLGDTSGQYTPGHLIQVLVASMTRNEKEVLDLIADLVNVDRSVLNNPDKFPMDSMIDIFEALAEHQDLKAFLARIAVLTERMPEMQTASQEASNS